MTLSKTEIKKYTKLTDEWIDNVIVKKSPALVTKMFSKNGILLGTVSKQIREGKDIKCYFKFFVNLPSLDVIYKKYKINEISNNVYVNNAFITFSYNNNKKKEIIKTRITFIFKSNKIFLLHSSELPDLNKKLISTCPKTI